MLSLLYKNICKFLALVFLALSFNSCVYIQKEIGIYSDKEIPTGEYIGTAKTVGQQNGEVFDIKVTFLPREQGLHDAIGILVFDNSSDRFMWRSDGNNNNIWNLMFSKDNTIYTDIKNSFEFSGIVKSSDIVNYLEGKLTRTINEVESIYYFEAKQIFDPEIIPPKEAIAVKAGEEISIQAKVIDPDKTKILIYPAQEKEAEPQEIDISSSSKEEDIYTLSFLSSKDQKKGKYKVFLQREDGRKTKSIFVELK